MTSNNEISVEIDKRTTTGWQRFGKYSKFMKDSKKPTCLKHRILDEVMLPAMTYGAETWALTKRQKTKLAAAQRSMERSILNITKRDHHIRNEEIRKRTGVKDILEKIHDVKGRWAGHLARMRYTRWTKITTEWTPRQGKRKRGRPRKRWRDDIEEKGDITWMRIAMERSTWHQLWRLPACSGMNS